MGDLISRQDAIDALEWTWAGKAAFDAIKNLPSAQPEPRTAYWEKDIYGEVVCSNCGGIRRDDRIGHVQWCNCCGCFMQGEEDENF